jgi:hypothetical protein
MEYLNTKNIKTRRRKLKGVAKPLVFFCPFFTASLCGFFAPFFEHSKAVFLVE